MHQNGVVHRDIKPENIIFKGSSFESIKIADFGLAKLVFDDFTQTPCGTIGYLAPEIAKDERYSKSVDVWALGCVLYTLYVSFDITLLFAADSLLSRLCGFPPFYEENVHSLVEKVRKGEYDFPSPWWNDISDAAKDLIRKLLNVNPQERLTIGQFFEHPWMKDQPASLCPTPGPLTAHKEVKSMPMKTAFEVSYAVQRSDGTPLVGSAGGGHSRFIVTPKRPFELNEISSSTMLERRKNEKDRMSPACSFHGSPLPSVAKE